MEAENTVISPEDLVALIDHAEGGDPIACITLGRLYYEGICVPRDKKRAEAMYYAAELTGDAGSLRILGSMYLNGDCAPVREENAARLFRKAAQKDDALAQYYIGEMYRRGIGVETSPTKAEMWLSRAAKNGIRSAARA
jgi:TPR repeat protein